MGVAARAHTPDANDTLLTAAGYVFHADANVWLHPRLDRALDGGIAKLLTVDQLAAWIAAGPTQT